MKRSSSANAPGPDRQFQFEPRRAMRAGACSLPWISRIARLMLPEIVTFWHGPMDALRQTCLRSQLAAGHKVTVYSFDTIPGLPAGIENADAEAILPHAFSE